MEERSDLGARKVAVLRAVIEEFVRTGEAVGSETIAESYNLGVSSATIRNELAALEELGFLTHPHTSAGRVPTDLGYRRYVDSLPAKSRLRDAQRRAIGGFFQEAVGDLEEVLRGAAQLLSQLTQYAGLAVAPAAPEASILRTELVEMGTKILVLVITEHGQVLSRMIERPEGTDRDEIEALSRRLAEETGEHTLHAAWMRATQLAREANPDAAGLLALVAEAIRDIEERPAAEHVLVGGVANLAGEVALARVETMHRLFEAIEHEAEVLRLLREASVQTDLLVRIGREDPATGQWDASVVAAPYRAGEAALGTIGVVGPTRMDYQTTMSAVRVVAKRLSDLAEQLGV